MTSLPEFRIAACVVIVALCVPTGWAQRTQLEPGFNLFSAEQDIEMGRQVAGEAEAELSLIDDSLLAEYINRLGQQLATVTPFADYPYQFTLVNDSAINAFALPGGFIYINRGIISTADREAEVAGVLGHEIAHVALRHGTNQASRAYVAQAPLALLGGLFGGGSGVGSILTQLGIGFGANSLFMKFSRDAERQADLMGAQILFDAGYDPTGMTEFFEKLAAGGGSRGSEFFSSHPNPGNRREDVAAEIQRLGDRPSRYIDNFSEFRRVSARLADIPEPAVAAGDAVSSDQATVGPPDLPSVRFQSFQIDTIELLHPDNREIHTSDTTLTIAPDRGIASDNGSLGYGFLASRFELSRIRSEMPTLEDATDQLIASLREANPSMRIGQGYRRERLGGRNALSVGVRSESPFGGSERDWLMTAYGPDGRFYYFIGVAPESAFDNYEDAFERIFSSIRFR